MKRDTSPKAAAERWSRMYLQSAALRVSVAPTVDNYIALFREQYVAGRIEVQELERRIERALAGTCDFQVFA